MLKYKVISKTTHKVVTPEEVQRAFVAGGHNPQFILLPSSELRLRTHDATGYHHFELDANYEAMTK